MKKQYIWRGILGFLVIALAVLFICYFLSKRFLSDISADEVAAIEVFDGSTGARFTLCDPDEIAAVVQSIQEIRMRRDGLSVGHDGTRFHLRLTDAEGDELERLILNSESTVRDDPFFYRCDGGLPFSLLEELEEIYATE